MVKLVGAALLLFSLNPLSASAQSYSAREVGGWSVAESSDGESCFIGMEYEGEGETSLVLALKLDGTNLLGVSNSNWSIKDGEKFSLDFELSNGVYEDHPAFGSKRDSGGGGFGTRFEPKFPEYFAQSKYLHIKRQGAVVDNLSLSGTGLAVAELRRCVSVVRARVNAEAREKARLSHIPKNPFATGTADSVDKD